MAHLVKAAATKPDGLKGIPGTHMVEEEKWLACIVSDLYMCTQHPPLPSLFVPPYPPKYVNTHKKYHAYI